MTKGWRNWFCRVSEKKGGDWELYDLNQCLTLSLSKMERNDSLLIAASYFWSNALNAFIFGQFLKRVLVFEEDKSTADCLKGIWLVSW